MKFCSSPTSPFARKAMVTALEKGVDNQLEMVSPDLTDVFKGINPSNPLGKIPSLELDDGTVIFDSIVIAEYLDSISDSPSLFPSEPAARAKTMTLHALANGMTDAAFTRRWGSTMLPEDERSPSWNARLKLAIDKSLDQLEAQIDDFAGKVDIAAIAIGCALGYLDFRFAEENWRDGHSKLAAWYEEFAARPSMKATVPPEG
ncbi:glutathione S-transferase [Sneathiella sp. P13V-1]|uniref:glutathione S-transferase family protein n=1 Tax=Sneathiella sp. P13V-1 TaxID=2697366 RepID=UPI00187B9512|nr:glutathione S-transferase family protein [Sneathiella sp. P13V-1]MBE7636332.1 glutathione S-transferase [Sneathiella sp. P13V-1]